jgi:hypothetical protein
MRPPTGRRPGLMAPFVSLGKGHTRRNAVRFFCPRGCRRNMLDRSVPKHGRHWWRLSPEDVVGLMNLQRMHQYPATASRSVRVAASGKSSLRRRETQFSRAETKTPNRPLQFNGQMQRQNAYTNRRQFGAIRTEPGNLRLRRTAWWGWKDSNFQPNGYQPLALSIERPCGFRARMSLQITD